MSGWHSLSGYLQYQSGNSVLGRLITKRKVWCILEESLCQLQYYKQEEDAYKHCQPQGCINLHASAIMLDMEHQNQFIVLSEKKEHVFTAENHESMMIWLLGLQMQRDQFSKNFMYTNDRRQMNDTLYALKAEDHDLWRNRQSVCITSEQNKKSYTTTKIMQSSPALNRGFFLEAYGSKKGGESVDMGISHYKKPKGAQEILDNTEVSRTRSLPPVFEGLETMSRSFPSHEGLEHMRPMSNFHSMLSVESDSDDVFKMDEATYQKQMKSLSGNWKKLQFAVMEHVISKRCMKSEVLGRDLPERQSVSSRSASSDSAIERGEGTAQELTARLNELERELISTKRELAKVMNRQTCYQELLQQKDCTIKHMEGHGNDDRITGDKETRLPSKNKKEQEFLERIRILQNQNRFLNEEVKKLAKLRLEEHGKYHEQNIRLQALEAEIEKWKIDYVSLIQSCIHYPEEGGLQDVELCLYGGDKHKKRVQALLEEARKINPRLPTFEGLTNHEVHIDKYGFKHAYTSTGLILHYLCAELTHHYLMQAGVYEEHQKRWTIFMRQHGKDPMKCKSELKTLCRGGIPDRFRKQIWRHLVHHNIKDILKTKGEYYYRNLCNLLPESPFAACYRKQVSLDLMRTMPSNVKFSNPGSKGIMELQDILLAFCLHNPTIGYCQGMNFIVGMALILLEPEDAFWTLVAVAERYFSQHYFNHNLIGAQSDQQVLKDMVREKLPALYKHLEDIDIELSTVTLNWFLAVFFDAVPFQTLLRVWDCFLLEGPKVLFRFAIAILKLHEKDILQKSDTMGIMKHLKSCAKLTYDVEGLVKLAFEGLKTFPKRRDILSKQTCYLNTLKEKYQKKELQRLAFVEREQLYMNMEAECGTYWGIECAAAFKEGKVWFGYGDQHISRVSVVTCESGTMCSTDFKLDSRLMCMCSLEPDQLLLGTISWMLISLDVKTQAPVWQLQLQDAVLSVCGYGDDDVTRIFSGLADGTVAVVEKKQCNLEPSLDIMYIAVGQAPVTCLMLLGDHVWCASGNTVAIIHAKTLDAMDIFSVSVNPYDHILSLVPGDYGIWISLRGSSILELWDPETLNCRMLYDTRTDGYPHMRKEDDTYFNRARITSILAYGSTVWVGTGEGNLIIYEILESTQLMTPTEHSPSTEASSRISFIARPQKNKDLLCKEIVLRIHPVHDFKLNCDRSLETNSDSNDIEKSVAGEDNHNKGMKLPSAQSASKPSESLSASKQTESQSASTETLDKKLPGIKTDKNKTIYEKSMRLIHRSSSENDLYESEISRYCKDGVAQCCENISDTNAHIENMVPSIERQYSDSDLQRLEKLRNCSQTGNDTEMEEEIECQLEEDARRSSLMLLYESDADVIENVHLTNLRNKHRSYSCFSGKESEASDHSSLGITAGRRLNFSKKEWQHTLHSDGNRSTDSEHDLKHWKSMDDSPKASRPLYHASTGSLMGTQFSATKDGSIEEEDVFELELEKRARRESLRNNDIAGDINEKHLENINNKEKLKDIEGEKLLANGIQLSNIKTGNVIVDEMMNGKLCDNCKSTNVIINRLAADVNRITKESLDMEARERSINNIDIDAQSVADDYISSNPSLSTSYYQPVSSNSFADEKKTTLQLSENEKTIDLLSATINKTTADVKDALEVNNMVEVSKLTRGYNAVKDINMLCFECSTSNIKCENCDCLLVCQNSIKLHEEQLSGSEKLGTMSLMDAVTSENKSILNDHLTNGMCNVQIKDTDLVYNHNAMNDSSHEVVCNTELIHTTNNRLDKNLFNRDLAKENIERKKTHALQYVGPVGTCGKCSEFRTSACRDHSRSCCNVMLNTRSLANGVSKNGCFSKIPKLCEKSGNSEDLVHMSFLRMQNKCNDGEVKKAICIDGQYTEQATKMYDKPTMLRSLSGQNKDLTRMFPTEEVYTEGQSTHNKVSLWLDSMSDSVDNDSNEVKNGFNQVNGTTVKRHFDSSNDWSIGVNIKPNILQHAADSEQQVFARDEDKILADDSNVEWPNTLNLTNYKTHRSAKNGKVTKRLGSEGSDGSSGATQASLEIHVNQHDPGAQYRLEFSSVVLEPGDDLTSTPVCAENSSIANTCDHPVKKVTKYLESDNRKHSLDLGHLNEVCRKLESELGSQSSLDTSVSKESDRQKVFEFLKMPSLGSRQASLGLSMIEDDLGWMQLYSGHCRATSPTSSVDKKLADFMRTPSLSSKVSSMWSSYENVSTPSQLVSKDQTLLRPTLYSQGRLSHSASFISIGSDKDLLYSVDLNLDAKIKISDKPVKCLIATMCKNEPMILSFSGSFGDDETVLRWRKHENEQLWTNEPVLELCLRTHTAILPSYIRRRFSSGSLYNSVCSKNNDTLHCMASINNK